MKFVHFCAHYLSILRVWDATCQVSLIIWLLSHRGLITLGQGNSINAIQFLFPLLLNDLSYPRPTQLLNINS